MISMKTLESESFYTKIIKIRNPKLENFEQLTNMMRFSATSYRSKCQTEKLFNKYKKNPIGQSVLDMLMLLKQLRSTKKVKRLNKKSGVGITKIKAVTLHAGMLYLQIKATLKLKLIQIDQNGATKEILSVKYLSWQLFKRKKMGQTFG